MTAKLFVFANTYISDLQKGLQTAHLVGDMAWEYTKGLKAKNQKNAAKLFNEWWTIHRTIIILRGGNHRQLDELYDRLKTQKKYPVGIFQEDHESLRGANTVVGIILPDPFDSVDGRNQITSYQKDQMSEVEQFLITLLDSSHLA